MSLRRFLVDPAALSGEMVDLDKIEANHARKVLRLSSGQEVELLDGFGKRARAVIEQLGKNGMTCRVLKVETAKPLDPKVVICPGLAKGPAMDFIAAKLTELAVDEMRPFMARRSEPRIKDPETRLERWQRLAGQALKQCGAPRMPEFFAPIDFADLLTLAPADVTRVMLYERWDGQTMADALAARPTAREVWIIIGPEGGFESEEADQAAAAGFALCGLPGTILRAETACLAAAAVARFGCRS